MSQSKERTAPLPHRVYKKASLYLIPQQQLKDGTYSGKVNLSEDMHLEIGSKTIITPKDGRVFEYTLSRIYASKSEDLTIAYDISELLSEMGIANRTENRQKIIQSLEAMVNAHVTLSWNGGQIAFSFLDSVDVLDKSITVKVTLSQSFMGAMGEESAKKRFINITRIMKAKSQYTMELGKLLQLYGKGVNKHTRAPETAKEIDHDVICNYLYLQGEEKQKLTQLRKCFNELYALGFPRYSYNSTRNLWKIIDT